MQASLTAANTRSSCRGSLAHATSHCFCFRRNARAPKVVCVCSLLPCSGINLCVHTPGPTGGGVLLKGSSASSNTWATNLTSTRWAGRVATSAAYDGSKHYFLSHAVSASRTKIFIRHPRTLFETEDAFQVCKNKLGELWIQLQFWSKRRKPGGLNGPLMSVIAATRIQAKYKGYRVKGDYLKQKEAGQWAHLLPKRPQMKQVYVTLRYLTSH